MGQLANAVNRASWLIDAHFGNSKTFDVIAYLGVSDVRYAVFTFAAIKTGHQVSTGLTMHVVLDRAKVDSSFRRLDNDPVCEKFALAALVRVRSGIVQQNFLHRGNGAHRGDVLSIHLVSITSTTRHGPRQGRTPSLLPIRQAQQVRVSTRLYISHSCEGYALFKFCHVLTAIPLGT
jgi:hypothetical protein